MCSYTGLLKISKILEGFPFIVPTILIIIRASKAYQNLLFFSRTISQIHRQGQSPRHSFNLYWTNQCITEQFSNILSSLTSCNLPSGIFILWLFWATKLNWLNRSEAVVPKTVVLMDHEIIWLKAFVWLAFVFVLYLHDCLNRPGWRSGKCSGHWKVSVASSQLVYV